MPRPPTIADLKKKWKLRLAFAINFFPPVLIAYLIGDELIKEGYPFDPRDILYPGTHEFLVVLTLAGWLAGNLALRKIVKGWGRS